MAGFLAALLIEFRITGVFGGLRPGVPWWVDHCLEAICYISLVLIVAALIGLIAVGCAWVVRGIRG